MTIAPHFFAGAALAEATTNSIPVAFLIGFFSHFLLDAIPHIDPGTFHNIKVPLTDETIHLKEDQENKPWPLWIYIFVFLEFAVVVTIFYFLFSGRSNFIIMSVGALGGITVDIFDSGPWRFIQKWPVFRQIHWLHKKVHYDLPAAKWYWGLPSQIIMIGVCLWLLLK